MTEVGSAPPGWYADPAGRHPERFWDGEDWTDRVRAESGAGVDALPPIGEVRDRDPRSGDARSAWPLPAAWVALAGWGIAAVVAGVVSVAASSASTSVQLASSQVALWSVLVATATIVSRRHGSGSLVNDYEWRLGLADIGPGLLAAFLARVFAGGIAVVLMLLLTGDLDAGSAQSEALPREGAAVAVFAVIAVVGAPVFEELFFRGLLQRALEAALHPAMAVAAASAAFGLVHIIPLATLEQNIATIGSIAAAGAVFGATARTTRRLGPPIIAHALFNLVAAVVLLTT